MTEGNERRRIGMRFLNFTMLKPPIPSSLSSPSSPFPIKIGLTVEQCSTEDLIEFDLLLTLTSTLLRIMSKRGLCHSPKRLGNHHILVSLKKCLEEEENMVEIQILKCNKESKILYSTLNLKKA